MSPEKALEIYKKLVEAYTKEYGTYIFSFALKCHIDSYSKHEWKAVEPAILDLALRHEIEILEIKSFTAKGMSRKDAILEVSKIMKITQAEMENVLKEVETAEKTKHVRKESEVETIRQQSQEAEETIKKLTLLFHKGEISESAYKTAIKSLEDKLPTQRDRSTTARANSFVERPYESSGIEVSWSKPSLLWYLLPLFFGLLGGIIGYITVKDEDRDMADNILLISFFIFFVDLLFVWLYWNWLLSLFEI